MVAADPAPTTYESRYSRAFPVLSHELILPPTRFIHNEISTTTTTTITLHTYMTSFHCRFHNQTKQPSTTLRVLTFYRPI